MKDYNHWKEKFDKQELVDFTFNEEALFWLKLKSISRKETMNDFLAFSKLAPESRKVNERWKELYSTMCGTGCLSDAIKLIDDFSKDESKKQLDALDIDALSLELYKVQSFKWGGDRTNSLDRYLVTKYVKAIRGYEELMGRTDEIKKDSFDYVLSSWYNHWSSILIEHIFKSHSLVIPTVGQIKGVDFFIDGKPFDLKVTHLPKGFIDLILKNKNYKTEISYLKDEAKKMGISYSKDAGNDVIYYQIRTKMEETNADEARNVLRTLKDRRKEILHEARTDYTELVRWLYENQGDMRFGAENRLFVVLVDNDNWDNSWMLKRNIKLLRPNIKKYLDNFKNKRFDDLKIEFSYKSKVYTAYADILFIVKGQDDDVV